VKILIKIAFIIFLAAASHVHAQPEALQPTAAEEAAETPSRIRKFDDWYLRCLDVQKEGVGTVSQCEVAQVAQIKQGEEDVNVLTLAIARTGGDSATAGGAAQPGLLLTALVPLNVFLPAGLALGTDGKPLAEIPYRNCNQSGCWAQQRLDADTTRALKRGLAGEGRLQLMNGQNVNIRFSLKGLTAALDALQQPVSE
jgi:invasion protein IalB